jgi:hypothetical protein
MVKALHKSTRAGHHNHMKQSLKIAIGVISTAFGIFLVAVSILFAGPVKESRITRVSGVFSEYAEQPQVGRSVVATRYIALQDGRVYAVDTETDFNEDLFLSRVRPGDTVELIVANSQAEEPAALALYKNGEAFTDYEDSRRARQSNQTIGIILGAAFVLAGLCVFFAVRKRRAA